MPEINQHTLPRCTGCGRQMSRGGSTYARLRANPSLLESWTCPACRGRTPRPARPAQTQASQPSSAQPPRTPQGDELVLDRRKAMPDIDIKKYEHFYTGYELECSGLTEARAKTILGFKGTIGDKSGKARKECVQRFNDGTELKYFAESNLYKEPGLITAIYHDPSVGTEVVTRPVPLHQFSLIAETHKKMKDAGADFWSDGRAGTHMTFLTDPHDEISTFDPAFARNLIQFCRAFYKDISEAFPGGPSNQTRGTRFRQIATINCTQELDTVHYHCPSLRKKDDGRIWAIEIRFPDGTMDADKLYRQQLFWNAVFREVAIITKFGQITFSQTLWEENIGYYRDNVYPHTATGQLSARLEETLKPSLKRFGWYGDDTDADLTIRRD